MGEHLCPASVGRLPPMLVLVVLVTHPRVGVDRVQCTPRLLATAEFLDRIKCGMAKGPRAKRLGVAVAARDWSYRVEIVDI